MPSTDRSAIGLRVVALLEASKAAVVRFAGFELLKLAMLRANLSIVAARGYTLRALPLRRG